MEKETFFEWIGKNKQKHTKCGNCYEYIVGRVNCPVIKTILTLIQKIDCWLRKSIKKESLRNILTDRLVYYPMCVPHCSLQNNDIILGKKSI